jgi:hypothetical protein
MGMSSKLEVQYKICKNSIGDFSQESDQAYVADPILKYSESWARETILNAIKQRVFPELKRVVPFQIPNFAAKIFRELDTEEEWEVKSAEFDAPIIEAIADEPDVKTFLARVTKHLTLREITSLKARPEVHHWDVDVRIDLVDGVPQSIAVTRILDTTESTPYRWTAPLPKIDIKEYM